MTSRKERAFKQQIFLLQMNPITKQHERVFKVVGTTRNIYTVKINERPNCSCPDYDNGNICKHIYFILLRVMKINGNVKSKYNEKQLTNMFNNIPKFITENVVYNEKTKLEFEELINSTNNPIKNIKIIEQKLDDICPICLENIDNKNDADFCKYSCGKSVHNLCYGIWSKNNHNNILQCLFCRHPWYSTDNFTTDNQDDISDNNNDDSNDSDNNESDGNDSNNINKYLHINQYKIRDLQNICKQNGFPYYGTKKNVFDRIKHIL